MSMALVRKARKYNDVYQFIRDCQRSDRNNREFGLCGSMRQLAKIFYRAHRPE